MVAASRVVSGMDGPFAMRKRAPRACPDGNIPTPASAVNPRVLRNAKPPVAYRTGRGPHEGGSSAPTFLPAGANGKRAGFAEVALCALFRLPGQRLDEPWLRARHRGTTAPNASKEEAMPWDEIKPRKFPAFERELDGISKQTMEDHYKLYEGYIKKSNECRKRLNEFDYSEIEGNQVFSDLRAVSVDYTFDMLGFKNHELYF